jgi:hypothetical protein
MNHRMNCEDNASPCPQAATGPAGWDDERLLDHHLEELLGAFSAATRLRLPAPPDASG